MKKALIVQGGWQGHEPKQVADILAGALRANGFEVEISDTLDSFRDVDALKKLDLIVPEWTMGAIEREQLMPLLEAVRSGVGIAGVHGGMGDSFRQATEYQFMVGGQWVAHPGGDGIQYTVYITDHSDPIVAGLDDFEVCTEQYLMHVDPGNSVLAVTMFGAVPNPVTWTKYYGKGRVFYCSLGHHADVFSQAPQILPMVTRGMLWASESKTLAGL